MRMDNVGDVVLAGPTLRALREWLPGGRITLMTSPAGSQAAPLLPWIDDVIVRRVPWQDARGQMPLDPVREGVLIEDLRAESFDTAVILTSFSQSVWPPAYACYLAGIPVRLGHSREFGGSLLTHRADPPPFGAHEAERDLHVIESAGVPVRDRTLEVRVPLECMREADACLREAGMDANEGFIAYAPGASCAARRYDLGKARRLAALLAGTDLPLVVLGNAKETALAREMVEAAGPGRAVSLAGRVTIAEMAGVLARARALVTNDSGAMHVADALGTPLLVTFAGTELESQWRPRKAPARLLRVPTSCTPCYAFDCPNSMACLDIEPERVAEEAFGLIAEAPVPAA